jgi:hypothetical protein
MSGREMSDREKERYGEWWRDMEDGGETWRMVERHGGWWRDMEMEKHGGLERFGVMERLGELRNMYR